MRGLNRRRGAARLADERGAVAILVALLIVPLLGLGAIAVDVASLYSDRAQLRNAADAAAIAVALDCARGTCGNTVATATSALTANAGSADAADATLGTPTVSAPAVTSSGGSVTVTVHADQAHWFAPVLGQDSTRVTATATAAWATTTRARANFPLAISWCEYQAQIARYPLTNKTAHRVNGLTMNTTCAGPNGTTVTGGYALTTPDSPSVCRTTSTLDATIAAYPQMYSSGMPPSCTNQYLASLIGSDILFPVWDSISSSGAIHVHSYAAFHITGYDVYNYGDPALYGWFTYAAQQSDATTNPTSTAPDLGARSVYLQG
jgi:Flp pilus assembly protein TadG